MKLTFGMKKIKILETNNVSNHKDYARELDSLIEILNDKIIAWRRSCRKY